MAASARERWQVAWQAEAGEAWRVQRVVQVRRQKWWCVWQVREGGGRVAYGSKAEVCVRRGAGRGQA